MTDFVRDEIERSGSANFRSEMAEQAVLARMLTDSRDAELHASELSEHDFTVPAYGKLFRAIQAVVAQQMNVDLVTVDTALAGLFPQEYGMLSDAMVNATEAIGITGRRIDDYISIVRSLSARRRSISSFEGILAALKDPARDLTEVLEQARAESGEIQRGGHKWQTMQDVLLNAYDYLIARSQGRIRSITSGLDNVDQLVGGFFAGELTVIGARPAVGKSAFGANIALSAARQGFKAAIVSREMTDIQYGSRMLARESWVDGMNLRKAEISNDDWARIARSMNDLSTLPVDFMFNVRTVEELAAEVTRRVQRGELDLLVVDYLQLMETQARFNAEHLRVGFISTTLKHLATDCGIPIIALAQVNRDTDGQMPTLRNLKASGDIEQDADGVIFLHRPASANDPYIDPRDREFFEAYETQGLTYICIYVAKQRQGTTGKACVLFDAAHMQYLEIDRRR